MIDFFGAGFDAAERLGLLPELAAIHYPIQRLAFLAPDGAERASVAYRDLRQLFGRRHFNFLRGDLETLLHRHLPEGVPVRFGTTLMGVEQGEGRTRVLLSDGSIEEADLLVGADGVHSQVRGLVFGPEDAYTRFLGYHTAAYVLDHPDFARRLAHAFYTVTVPARQVGVYPLCEGRVATFFVHRAATREVAAGTEAALGTLRAVYGDFGWIVPELLGATPTGDVFLDAVSQIVMPGWSRGRVVLLGDAAWCVSLLAGQGASMALAGAYVLAEELDRGSDVPAALLRYEHRLHRSIEQKQRSGRRMARWFVPRSRLGISIRDAVLRMATGPVGGWLLKRRLAADSIFRAAG